MKRGNGNHRGGTGRVAPRAGAWIETNYFIPKRDGDLVAPRAGAWIETFFLLFIILQNHMSRPARARGLKHAGVKAYEARKKVAPRAGAWIETYGDCVREVAEYGRAPRGRVD